MNNPDPPDGRKARLPRWLLWTLLALFSWGVWAIISKLIGDALTAAQSQALSTLGLFPVMAALAVSRKPADAPRPSRGIGPAFVAGILACLGNVAYYHALNLGGKAATVIPLTGLYPLVTVILALLLLRERLNAIQIGGVVLSLLAMYLFSGHGNDRVLTSALAYALIPIALWGVAGLLQKISTNYLSGEISTLWFLAAFVPVATVILLSQPWPAQITTRTWLLVIALGLFFAMGNYGILAAFACEGKASIITPLSGLYPVVSVPIAIFFLGEKVSPRELAGIGVALASVIALSYEKPNTKKTTHEPLHET